MSDIRKSIRAGLPSVGVWSVVGSPVVAEIAGRAGLDWVLLDTQHGAVTEHDLLTCIQAVELGGSVPLVRVGANDPRLIMRALDLGAGGVVVPLVSSAREAADAVAAVRYPPSGRRSFGPTRRYDVSENGAVDPLCLVMIETGDGLDALEEIAATPGLDGVFLGPVDLGLDMGLGFVDPADPDVLRGPVERIVETASRSGLIAGSAAMSTGMAEWLLDAGMHLVGAGSDLGHITQGYAADARRRDEWREKYGRRPLAEASTHPREEGDDA